MRKCFVNKGVTATIPFCSLAQQMTLLPGKPIIWVQLLFQPPARGRKDLSDTKPPPHLAAADQRQQRAQTPLTLHGNPQGDGHPRAHNALCTPAAPHSPAPAQQQLRCQGAPALVLQSWRSGHTPIFIFYQLDISKIFIKPVITTRDHLPVAHSCLCSVDDLRNLEQKGYVSSFAI